MKNGSIKQKRLLIHLPQQLRKQQAKVDLLEEIHKIRFSVRYCFLQNGYFLLWSLQ